MFDLIIGFDAAKHMPGDQVRVTLGVQCDFSRVPLWHTITMEVTEERKEIESITEAEAVERVYSKSR